MPVFEDDQDRTCLGSLRTKFERLQTDVGRSLTDLGDGWDEDRVEGFDLSIPVKADVTDWRDRIADVNAIAVEAGRRVTDLEDRVREASAEREAREAELDKYPSLPSEDEVNESETKTRNLRIASRHVAGLRERARANDQQAAAVQAAVAGFAGAPASAVSPGILFAVPAMFGLAGVVAAIAGEMLSAVLAVVLAAVSGAGIAIWRRTARTGVGQAQPAAAAGCTCR